MMDGSGIRHAPGETFQQAVDHQSPPCVSAMLELLSPQIASASSYVSAVVTPSEVTMHSVEESDEEEPENPYAARCNDDLDSLSVDELQPMVHSLNNQLRRSGRPPAKGA